MCGNGLANTFMQMEINEYASVPISVFPQVELMKDIHMVQQFFSFRNINAWLDSIEKWWKLYYYEYMERID